MDAVNQDTDAGVMEVTQKMWQHYWRHWVNFLPHGFNPYLQNLDEKQQLVALQAFAQWARQGAFGQGKQVQTGSIQAVIGALPRPNWLAGKAHCTNPEQQTITPLLPCKWRVINEKTWQQQNKWQCP